MSIELKPGLIIRFDYLWRDEQMRGQEGGRKDRPCVIVVATKERADGSRRVMVCPITHSPPHGNQTAVEIPSKLAHALDLDTGRMWIKTRELNSFTWEKDRIPVGMVKTPGGKWLHGIVPYAIREEVLAQVRQNNREKKLSQVKRDDPEA